jgi:hypothetical protein
MGAFKTVGTTTGSSFVDTTAAPGVRYAYRVVAKGAGGGASEGSAVQVVPDPRPAISWADVTRAASRAAARPGASRGLRRAASALGTRRLQASSAAGRRAQAAALDRVARAAAPPSRLADLAWRLGTQVRLGDAGGGPATRGGAASRRDAVPDRDTGGGRG